MLKKIFSVLIAMVLLTGTAAAGDYHLDIQFVVHQEKEDTAVTAEAVLRGHDIRVMSGLFPSHVLVMDNDNAELLQWIDNLPRIFGTFSIPSFSEYLSAFGTAMQAETITGVFAGDLFDDAHTMKTVMLTPAEFMDEIMKVAAPEHASGAGNPNRNPETNLSGGVLRNISDIMIRCDIFDDGKYMTINGVETGRTLFTVACDFNNYENPKFVTGYPDNGKNYYNVAEFKLISDMEINISSELISDRNKTGYRTVMNDTPVLKENWDIKLAQDRKEISFSGRIIPANGKKTVEITGSISTENKPILLAKIGFEGWPDSWFTLAVTLDNTPVNTESLKAFSVLTGNEDEYERFTGEISRNMMIFLARLMQALPEDYRFELFPLN